MAPKGLIELVGSVNFLKSWIKLPPSALLSVFESPSWICAKIASIVELVLSILFRNGGSNVVQLLRCEAHIAAHSLEEGIV